MGINIPLFQGISLKIGDFHADGKDFPTVRLQKGFLLLDQGQDLAEEAVGFGVPVIKRGLQAIFPGDVNLDSLQKGSTWEVTAHYKMNLVERISGVGNKKVGNRAFYAAKDFLAGIIRRYPLTRGLLTSVSSLFRQAFKWKTTYLDADSSAGVKLVYTLEPETGKSLVDIDVSSLPPDVTEVVVMNEQGAHAFDRYRDSSGNIFQGDDIGCWDEVTAEEAWFESSTRKIAFRLRQVKGAQLFRGRELVGSRLAWSGFGYSFPPSLGMLHYELKIERLA